MNSADLLMVIAAVIVLGGLVYWTIRRSGSGRLGNGRQGTAFGGKPVKRPSSHQKCSRCKQMDKLTFYSNNQGTVMGLCKECRKKIGDRENLMPL
ncbi:MAG: hypothetical protein K0R57_4482 [Paenibacillaceae bacterium]|jgi:hypothetical protein|nr:hypothetical protein [Paenibacillaceae bacterium]